MVLQNLIFVCNLVTFNEIYIKRIIKSIPSLPNWSYSFPMLHLSGIYKISIFDIVIFVKDFFFLFGLGLILWQTNHCRLFNAKSIYIYISTVLFQTIQFSISTQFKMSKTVLFQAIQFSRSTQFSFIWSIDSTLLGATTLGQNGPGSNGSKGVLHIPQSSSITEASLLDPLESCQGHSLEESYPSTEMQLVYSTAPVGWVIFILFWAQTVTDLSVKLHPIDRILYLIAIK